MTGNTSMFKFPATLDALEAVVIHANLSQRGVMKLGGDGVTGSASEQDSALLNQIMAMTLASGLSNVAQGMPTDCPTRERKGWLGDTLFASGAMLYVWPCPAVLLAMLTFVQIGTFERLHCFPLVRSVPICAKSDVRIFYAYGV